MSRYVPRLAALLIVLASPATAQHNTFVDALTELTAALPGTYGDEGDAVRAAIDKLQRGLAEWDQTLREYESNVAAVRPTASAARVLEMHRTMGMFYLTRGRHADAIRELDAAVARSPEALFHLFRGLALAGAGRRVEALAAFAAATTLEAGDPVAAYMLADAAVRSGTAPSPAAVATLADVADRIAAGKYAGDRDPFLAIGVLADDVSDAPVFLPSAYAAAAAPIRRGDYAAAIDALRAAAMKDPLLAAPPPSFARGSAALRAGDVAAALTHFTAAVDESPSSEAHRMLGVVHWLSAQADRSIEQLELSVRRDPGNERARLLLARVLDDRGDSARAETALLDTITALPSSAFAHLRLGRLYASSGRAADAVGRYEAAAAIGALSGEAPLMVDIGDLYRRAFDYTRAEAAFARAVALRPNDAVAHRERGRALLQMERPDAALVELAAALLIDPDDYPSYLAMAQIHIDAGRYAQAVSLLTRATAIDSDKPEAYYALASVLTRTGRAEEATGHLASFTRLQQRALAEQRRSVELSAVRLQASVLTDHGAVAEAVKAWTALVAEWTDVADHHAGLAKALAAAGQVDSAALQYERALSLNAGPALYYEVTAFYDRLGRAADAARTRARLAQVTQAVFAGTSPRR